MKKKEKFGWICQLFRLFFPETPWKTRYASDVKNKTKPKKVKIKILPSLIPLISMISLNIWMTGTGWSTKLIKLCWMIWGPVIVASPVTVPVSGASATRVWRRGPWPWGWPIVCGSIMLEKCKRGNNVIRKILFLIVAKSFSMGSTEYDKKISQ